MYPNTATTTPRNRAIRWPAAMVFVVQLGMQWVLAQQFVAAGWVSGSEFLPALGAIAVVLTAIAVWGWRSDYFSVYSGIGIIGAVAVLHWMTPLVRAEIAQTLGDAYVARIDGWRDILYEIILHGISWWHHVIAGQASNDAVLFVVALALLTYLLAVISTWVLLRTHAVWLNLGISAIPLLLNYILAPQRNPISIGVFVGGALMLVAVNQIDWHEITWHHQQVTRPRQISIQLLGQALLIICVACGFAILLPLPARDARVVASWDKLRTPLTSLQQAWGWVLGSGQTPPPTTGATGGFASNSMRVGGARNLSQSEVLRVRTDAPDYLRMTTFDSYTGQGWRQQAESRDTRVAGDSLLTGNRPTAPLIHSEITVAIPQALGMLVSIGQPVQYSMPVTVTLLNDVTNGDDGIVAIRGGATARYQLLSYARTASSTALRNAPAPDEAIRRIYTALPETVPPTISAYASTIVTNAHAPTAYDKAITIQSALRTLQYDEQRPAPPTTSDWVDYFLFTSQRGYCDDFATAMVVLLRTQGIPARLAQGYAIGGADGDGVFVVRAAQAHSWVEVYFQGYGWQRFEPTPASYTSAPRRDAPTGIVATTTIATPIVPTVAPTFSPQQTATRITTRIATPARQTPPAQIVPPVADQPQTIPVAVAWGWVLMAVLIASACGGVWWWWRRRSIAQHITWQYWVICWLYRQHDLPLPNNATANEVAQLTTTTLPAIADMVGAVCHAYNLVHYANHQPTHVPLVDWLLVWRQLWVRRWRLWRQPPHGGM